MRCPETGQEKSGPWVGVGPVVVEGDALGKAGSLEHPLLPISKNHVRLL